MKATMESQRKADWKIQQLEKKLNELEEYLKIEHFYEEVGNYHLIKTMGYRKKKEKKKT